MTRREAPGGAYPRPAGSSGPAGGPESRLAARGHGPPGTIPGPRGRPGSRFVSVGGLVTALLGVFLWQGLAWAQEPEQEPEQERDCTLVRVGGYTESRRQDSINYTHRASGGVDYRCTDGTRILADSAVVWEHSGNAYFFGDVHFEDPDTELDADSARYFDNVQELIAYSNVVLTDRKGGAVIRGETLSYLSDSRFRKEDRIVVYGGSPRAVVYPARRPAAPVAVAEAVGDSIEEVEDLSGDPEEEDLAADSVPGGMDAPMEDSVPGEEDALVGDSVPGEEDTPVGDSVPNEMDAPPEDSVRGEEVDSTAAGAGEQHDPAADSVADEGEALATDSVVEGLPDRPPGAGLEDEFAELARLDSLAGISDETGAETEASPETEADSTDAPVDSVTPLPYEVEAPRIMIDGRRFFRAGGGVVVTRDSLRAVGDSLDYDQEVGAMLILGEASVEDSGFRLKGLSVAVTPTAGLNEEILAREEAELTGDEVLMTAPAIRLFLEESKVGRLVALPTVPPLDDGAEAFDTTGLTPGDAARVRAMAEAAAAEAAAEDSLNAPDSLPRPSVIAAEFNLTGDSIEVLSPGQVLDEVTAIGAARADAMGQDSLMDEDLPEVARNDWLEGETIIARFASVDSVMETAEDSTAAQPGPTGRRARLETLTAINDARSFYRLYTADTTEVAADTSDAAPADTTDEPDPPPEEPPAIPEESTTATDQPDSIPEEDGTTAEECDTTGADGERRPELHYVSGNQITIFLDGRQVVKMEVAGQTQGYHFEPVSPDCESAASDSATVAPDTLTTPPDTTPLPPHPSTATPRHPLPNHPRRTTPPTRPARRTGGPS